jgi:protocatechuate 3,4-dioxygenase beta subunit
MKLKRLRHSNARRSPGAWRCLGASCAFALTAALLAHHLPVGGAALAPGAQSESLERRQSYALRVVLFVRGSRAVPFDTAVVGVTVVNPEFVTAQVSGGRTVIFTGVAEGEAMVIVAGAGGLRRTAVVEVRSRPAPLPAEARARDERRRQKAPPTGTYTLSLYRALGDGPALLRQTFDFTRRLASDRTVRLGADLFKFFGRGENSLTQPAALAGIDRASLGVDTAVWRFDLLDSELSVSPLSLHGYTMRGPHLATSAGSRLRGLELFAGAARPARTLFDNSEGYLGGAVLPLADGPKWRARAALLAVAPRGHAAGGAEGRGGLVWHLDARFAPDERTRIEGEAAYARDSVSWRARAEARRGDFDFYAEALRFDGGSPLAALGAQPGGRRLYALAVNWRPRPRLSASFSYNRSSSNFVSRRLTAALDSSTIFAGFELHPTEDSRLGFRYVEQEIETGAGSAPPLRLQTRRLAATHSARLGRRWANEFEAAFTTSHELSGNSQIERGFGVREELRLSRDKWSATAFVNYQSSTPSLAGLVVRNPHLLPTAYRLAYESDPARFLASNRGLLPSLLAGVTLPETRSALVGLRLQAALSRYQLIAESRYSGGETLARERSYMATNFTVAARLDPANSVRVTAARSFAFDGTRGHASFTVSFVHRFGVHGGLNITRLLGLDRGHIEGRAFFDLNSDGRDDPDEPGAAGVTVQLDGRRHATTDGRGRFRFSSLPPGEYAVTLLSDKLGVKLRASTATERFVTVVARQTVSVGFGLTDSGSVGGRVFNDLQLKGASDEADAPGVSGVRIHLRGAVVLSLTTDASGLYEFTNLAPGDYTLELDPMSLPADFRVPAQLSWPVTVSPLESCFLDIPLVAQRAVSGIVFLDRDGDGRFDPARDTPLAGARVTAGRVETVTDASGSYLLRGLPSGQVVIRVTAPDRRESREAILNLSIEPTFEQGFHLGFAH